MSERFSRPRLIVTGASGQFGQLVLSELLNTHRIPARHIIATTRSVDKLARFANLGGIVRQADFNHGDALASAFCGGERMLLISTAPAELPYVDGVRLLQHSAAIEAARIAGVKHVLYTSGPNPEPGTPAFWLADHYRTELALLNSGLQWTILRNWEWPDWHLRQHWIGALRSGEYFAASGRGTSNHVTRDDCARAAAAALVSDKAENRRYDVTGSAPLTIDEILAIVSELCGGSIRVLHGTPEQYEARLLEEGVDASVIPFYVGYARAVRAGRYAGTTLALQELTGKAPHSLRDFLHPQIDFMRSQVALAADR